MLNMDTTDPTYQNDFLETFEVSTSTSTSIELEWHIHGFIVPFVNGFRVHYQKVASTYVQYGPELSPKTTEYHISNLVADTYYKVCLVTYRNDTPPIRECVDASTTNWQLPVSIGSSIGAILALSMIVLIVLLSRCKLPFKYRKKLKEEEAGKYDTMSSNYHDDRYEFSETVTHGHDDEFSSEMDHEESALYDTSTNQDSVKYSYKQSEKPCANGVPRNYVHPHGLHLGQHRNSTGKTHYHGHHHQRPTRTYSMQADGQFIQPCSPLAKEAHGIPGGHDWTEIDEPVETKRACDEKVLTNQRLHSQSLRDHSPPDPEKQTTTNKRKISQDMFICSQPISDLLFIDDIPDTGAQSSRWKPSSEMSHTDDVPGVSSEITFDDLSKYGASGGRDRRSMDEFRASKWDKIRALEMTSKGNKMAAPDCTVIMDEHSV